MTHKPCCLWQNHRGSLVQELEQIGLSLVPRYVLCLLCRSQERSSHLAISLVLPPPNLKTAPNKQMRLLWHPASLTSNNTLICLKKKRRPIKEFLTGRENSRVRLQLTWIKQHSLAEWQTIRSAHTGDKKHTATAGAADKTPTPTTWIIQPLTHEEAVEAEPSVTSAPSFPVHPWHIIFNLNQWW